MTPQDAFDSRFDQFSRERPWRNGSPLRLVSSGEQKLLTGRTLDDAVEEVSSFAISRARQKAVEYAVITPLMGAVAYLAGLTAHEQLSPSWFGRVADYGFAGVLAAGSLYCAYRAVGEWRFYRANKN